jgi:antitoxin YefM
MNKMTTLTASEAREDLYTLIRTASNGLRSYEINLRGADPVVLISKSEIESWLETLDVLSSPQEMEAINESKKDKKVFSHADVFKKLGLKDGNNL